ncbi:mucin-associated surface protein [Trypanosoma cruzi cruzi]|uniref:Mucin-associated surface protein (MASP) n=1 Tax=Trypanosoma cruzi TaxID=5693 RepID=A0A2V2UXF7_TRYCR|nr:mucin-associated surface protein [Trypanosoma cruzi cruzi]PWU86933.1 Mucin-associated surface protein (MASP) [Trypanosoma cruzi]
MMMTTGRVLLVCALCVLWCCVAAVAVSAAGAAGGGDGGADEYLIAGRHAQLRRECAERAGRRTGGRANPSAVEECVRQGMDSVRTVVDGRRRWRRQQFAVAAADGGSGNDGRNSASSQKAVPGTGTVLPDDPKLKSPVAPEPVLADKTTGGGNLLIPAGSLEMANDKNGEPSKETDKGEKPTVENRRNEGTNGDEKVDNAVIGKPNEDPENKKGETLQVEEEIVKTEEHEVKNGLEENNTETDKENRNKAAEDPEGDDEVTVLSSGGQYNEEGETQKEKDSGSIKKGIEVNGGGGADGISAVAPVALQPASSVDVTDRRNLDKKNGGDTGGNRDAGRTQTQESAGPSQTEKLAAELSTEEDAAETETGAPGKKTQPEDAGKEQTTVGAKSNQETPAAAKEANNKNEVPREEEDAETAATNENFDKKRTSGKDNAHNEAEKTRQENENEVEKAEGTHAEAEGNENQTGKKNFADKDRKLNDTATPGDSDSSTAVSHTTSPPLLLLAVVAAAAAVVAA